MIRVGILGHFAEGLEYNDGQTVKTREMFNELVDDGRFKVLKADTYCMKKSVTVLFSELLILFKNNDKIIICLSWNGYHKILPLLVILTMIFHRKLYDVVIGGSRQKYLANSCFYRYLSRKIKKIYVESSVMVKEYNNLKITNVLYMPNFKNIELVKKNVDFKSKVVLPICTFSRVCKEKGIEDAIEAVKQANKILKEKSLSLTIFGNVEKDYERIFIEIEKSFPPFLKYGGVIPYKHSSIVLANYYMLLFPTYWDSEGFPGTIIDAFAAGLPVIASDWNRNPEILEEGKTGFIVPVHDVDALAARLVYSVEHIEEIGEMRKNCLNKFELYLPYNAMKVLKEDLFDE